MSSSQNPELRHPTLEDGMAVYRLIERCPPLDTNSSYCNLLQCSHFAATSVAADAGGELVGFISGYLIPERPDTLFIWQVAVDEKGRGMGLGKRMLAYILDSEACGSVRYMETTITESNEASWAMFRGLAKQRGGEFNFSPWLDRERHFDGQHDSEQLVRIGPFKAQ